MPPKYDGLEFGCGPQSAPIALHTAVETDPAAVISGALLPQDKLRSADTVIAGGSNGDDLIKELDEMKRILDKYEDDKMKEMQKKVDALAQSLWAYKQIKRRLLNSSLTGARGYGGHLT
ncbi:hypothetical protein AX16_009343 [Volvariella volvacea WC 439]|nr:hypothetical protein AX16_009343 [Volvariella volvacea WC 439]